MRRILQTVSWIALIATVLPSILFFADRMDLPQAKTVMLLATVAWFVVTPLWMGQEEQKASES
jgi:hypothetical protein